MFELERNCEGVNNLKKFIDKWVFNYVRKSEKLQTDIVTDWTKGVEIATYHIKDSEITLGNVNMIYSTITGCTIKEIKNSVFEDSLN
jgi:hypothetical protein